MKSKLSLVLLLIVGLTTIKAQSNFIGSGISLEFDGNSDNYYDLGDVFNTLNFPVTFESWVNQAEYSLFTPIFASDCDTFGYYYGLYIRFDPVGKIMFEIGSGTGSGGSHRRGKTTTTAVPLDTWTHIAIVATSITDIKFYFNGVLQPAINTDGTSGVTSMVHNVNHANLGRYATVHRSDAFIGQIDECRLWNIARTETELRQYMCKKLTGSEDGLIGYWKADESYFSSTLEDYSISNADGIEIGIVNRLTSGAPIGDFSIYNYSYDYSGLSLTLNSPGGDKLKVNKIGNSPNGVHVYRINSSPYSGLGLNENTNYYYGVFTVDNASAAKYTIAYSYTYGNGVVNVLNETEATVYKRQNASFNNWTYLNAILNTGSKRLTKKNISSNAEFIFNIDPNDEAKMGFEPLANTDYKILISPNPTSEFVNFNNEGIINELEIFNIHGQFISRYTVTQDSKITQINISNLQNGIYLVRALNNQGVYLFGKFEVIKN